MLIRAHSCLVRHPNPESRRKPTTLITNLDGDNAPPLKNKVTSFQVLVGGAAELYVHFLDDGTSTGMNSLIFFPNTT